MADVHIKNAEKTFGNVSVLKGISLDIADGEFLVLVGPSGCGKSTLLRMIAGLDSFSAGSLRVGDRDVTELPPKNRDMAMVFQNYALYPHMTVERNLGFSLELKRASKEEKRQKVQRAAEILDLGPMLKRYPRQLSGGQRQRVAMGRAIVREPQVFQFDEPLSNLDAKLRVVMRAEIKALHQRLGTTIIYVTHDQVEAMTMADRIAVMNNGRVEQLGTPLELYDHPKTMFVASFIGSPSMNLVGGRLTVEGSSTTFTTATGDTLALHGQAPAEAHNRAIVLGFRPEDLVLAPEGLEQTIKLIEPMGAETHVLLETGSERMVLILRERQELRVGETIRVAPRPNRVHYFDQATGMAIA